MRSELTGNISLGLEHQGLTNRGLKSKVETLSRTVAPSTRNWRLKWQALLCFQADHEVNQDQLEQQAEESVVFHLSGGWVSLSHLTSVDMINSNSVSIVFDSRIRLEWFNEFTCLQFEFKLHSLDLFSQYTVCEDLFNFRIISTIQEKNHVWPRQGRKGTGEGWSQEAQEGAEGQHPGHHQARHQEAGPQGWSQEDLWAHLRGNQGCSQGKLCCWHAHSSVYNFSCRYSWRMSSVALWPTPSTLRGRLSLPWTLSTLSRGRGELSTASEDENTQMLFL